MPDLFESIWNEKVKPQEAGPSGDLFENIWSEKMGGTGAPTTSRQIIPRSEFAPTYAEKLFMKTFSPEAREEQIPPAPSQAIPEKPSFARDVIGGTVKKFGKTVVGAGEAGAGFAGGMLSFFNPIPGLAGIGKIVAGASPEEATKAIQDLQASFQPFLVYEPKTEEGRKGKQIVDWAFELIHKAGKRGGEKVQDITEPVVGKTVGAALGATVGGAAELIVPALLFGALGKPKRGVPKAPKVEIESMLRELGRNPEKVIKEAAESAGIKDVDISAALKEIERYEEAYKPRKFEIEPPATLEVTKEPPKPPTAELLPESKVRDEAGVPLTMYHASKTPITEWKEGQTTKFYSRPLTKEFGENVVEARLDIRNPAPNLHEWTTNREKYDGAFWKATDYEGKPGFMAQVKSPKQIIRIEKTTEAPKFKKPWEMTRRDIEAQYPLIGKKGVVDGRTVRRDIPNQSSIEASVDNATVLPGVREVSLDMFDAPPAVNAKTKALAEAIKESGEINPLIVVIDKEGPYILEGANRYDAMKISGAKSIPAMVVIDEGSFYQATKKAISEGKPVPPEVLKDYPDLAPKPPMEGPGKGGGRTTLGFGPTSELQKLYETITRQKERTDPLVLPKYARSVNLRRQNVPEKFKEFEVELSKILPEKKYQSWDKTDQLSTEIMGDLKRTQSTLKKARERTALDAAEIDAVRKVNVNAINRLVEIAETAPRETVNELLRSYSDNVFMSVSEAANVAGQALNIFRKDVSLTRMGKAFYKIKGKMNERQFKEFQEIAPLLKRPEEWSKADLDKMNRFIERLPDPAFKDYFYEYWYNSILSGIPTHIVNFASNTMWQAWSLGVHHPMSAFIDATVSKLTGRPREIFMGEMLPMLAGVKKGAKKGATGTWEVLRTGEAAEWTSKWDREVGYSTISAFERSPNAKMRALAPYITMPTRGLRAMDVWANSIAYDAKLNGLTRREGLRRGLSGEKLAKFEQEFKPTKEMMDQSTEFAQHMTFMDEPGAISEKIIRLRDAVPGGRLIVPFVNTIGNLMKRGLEMTPGIGIPMLGKYPLAEAIAKQIEGAIIALPIYLKCIDGEITGPVPENAAERERFYAQGKEPWSIKLGDNWHAYRRVEPFNTVIASVATAHEKIKRAKNPDDWATIFTDVAKGIKENLLDSSYLSSLQQWMSRYGSLSKLAYRQVASLVPYSSFWRSINRAMETMTEGSAKVRENKGFIDALAGVVPFVYDKVPAKLDVWGKEIELPGGAFRQWLPYKWNTATTDRVEIELERLQMAPASPSKTMTFGNAKVELPEDFWREYVISFGNDAKRKLDEIVWRPGYIRMNEEQKIKVLDQELRRVRSLKSAEAKSKYIERYGYPPQQRTPESVIRGNKIYIPAPPR
uniref:Putative structural protein n=1 Tax=viral metagenome TaxID=1070528 RepID=A0A6M3ILN7_9ZZZZ